MTELAFSAVAGEHPDRPIITVVADALEVLGLATAPEGRSIVLLIDGTVDGDLGHLTDVAPAGARVAIGIPPLDAARLAVELHAAASAALQPAAATGGRPGHPGE